MSNQIEKQIEKIQKEKMKLKAIKEKIEREKFEKVYYFVKENYELLPNNFKTELKNYFDISNKTVKNVENTTNIIDKN
jgi:hypothetical protein